MSLFEGWDGLFLLTRLLGYRNRLGAKTAEGFARMLSLPAIEANKIETKNSLGDRMPSAYGFAAAQGSARKTWGKTRSGKKKESIAKNPIGGGLTLTEVRLGWNALGTEGTKKILGMVKEETRLNTLRLENCLEGGGSVYVDPTVLRRCDIVTSFPANSIGGFGGLSEPVSKPDVVAEEGVDKGGGEEDGQEKK